MKCSKLHFFQIYLSTVDLRVVGVPGKYHLEEEHGYVSDSEASEVIEVQISLDIISFVCSCKLQFACVLVTHET